MGIPLLLPKRALLPHPHHRLRLPLIPPHLLNRLTCVRQAQKDSQVRLVTVGHFLLNVSFILGFRQQPSPLTAVRSPT